MDLDAAPSVSTGIFPVPAAGLAPSRRGARENDGDDPAGAPEIERGWHAATAAALSFQVTEAASVPDFQALYKALDAETAPVAGHADVRGLAIWLRDASGAVAGGLVARTVYRWLTIELLLVPQAQRGLGIGAALVRTAEAVAQTRGCLAARVETFDFQARPFYEKLGYAVFAVQDGLPPGHRSFFLSKPLDPAACRGRPTDGPGGGGAPEADPPRNQRRPA